MEILKLSYWDPGKCIVYGIGLVPVLIITFS